mmetsp:Transcript_45396/g.145660  ORF Transcript_45396/g.145660 Transcript_45396/m.145660 type:complete len:580 (-) Transcript_45396:2050-3789(-)
MPILLASSTLISGTAMAKSPSKPMGSFAQSSLRSAEAKDVAVTSQRLKQSRDLQAGNNATNPPRVSCFAISKKLLSSASFTGKTFTVTSHGSPHFIGCAPPSSNMGGEPIKAGCALNSKNAPCGNPRSNTSGSLGVFGGLPSIGLKRGEAKGRTDGNVVKGWLVFFSSTSQIFSNPSVDRMCLLNFCRPGMLGELPGWRSPDAGDIDRRLSERDRKLSTLAFCASNRSGGEKFNVSLSGAVAVPVARAAKACSTSASSGQSSLKEKAPPLPKSESSCSCSPHSVPPTAMANPCKPNLIVCSSSPSSSSSSLPVLMRYVLLTSTTSGLLSSMSSSSLSCPKTSTPFGLCGAATTRAPSGRWPKRKRTLRVERLACLQGSPNSASSKLPPLRSASSNLAQTLWLCLTCPGCGLRLRGDTCRPLGETTALLLGNTTMALTTISSASLCEVHRACTTRHCCRARALRKAASCISLRSWRAGSRNAERTSACSARGMAVKRPAMFRVRTASANSRSHSKVSTMPFTSSVRASTSGPLNFCLSSFKRCRQATTSRLEIAVSTRSSNCFFSSCSLASLTNLPFNSA